MELSKGKRILFTTTLFFAGSYFIILCLVKAQDFLAPLVLSIVLALLMIPLANKLETKGINRAFSSLLCTFLLFLISLGIFALLSFQVKNFINDWDKIKEQIKPKIEKAENFIYEYTNYTKEEFEQYKKKNDISTVGGEPTGEQASNVMSYVMSFISNYLLTFIYIFFLLNYRRRFKIFFLKLTPKERQKKTRKIINETAGIAQKYLVGKFLLIILLAVLYSIGLGISGVNNFFLISFIAAFLSLLPYIGNIIGLMLALVFGFLNTGDTTALIGIIITFGIVQFIESYILEPYIVGFKVNVHPFLVILAVIAGNMIWGVMGMILAIPVLGILNVIMRNVPSLEPFGYLLSIDDKDEADGE